MSLLPEFELVVVVAVLLDSFLGMEHGGILQTPNSRATHQDQGQRSKTEEVVTKMARRRGSDAGQFRRS